LVDGARRRVVLDERVIERLRKSLEAVDGLVFAALFGSLATRGFSLHDVDVAVKASGRDKYEVLLEVAERVAGELGVSVDLVDVVDLDRASLELKKRVVEEGLVLVDRGYWRRLAEEVARRYPEYAEHLEFSIKEWLSSPDPTRIDVGVLKRRMDFIRSETEFLEEYVLSKDPAEVAESPVYRRLLERSYQLIVEAMVDVCRHVVSAKGWSPAYSSREYVEECARRGVVSRDLGQEIVRAIGLRNIIIHRYLEVDYSRLYREAVKLAALAREFEKQLVQFIRREVGLRP